MSASISSRTIPVMYSFLCVWLMTAGGLRAAGSIVESEWKVAGLDDGFLEEQVNTRSCQQTVDQFIACVAAIQAMLDLGQRELQLTSVRRLHRGDDAGGRQHRFGSIVVQEMRQHDAAGPVNILAQISAKRQRILDWQQICHRYGVPEADFTRLLEWSREQLGREVRPEDATAAAINGYLGVEDAHARIVPAQGSLGASYSRSASVTDSDTGGSYSGIGASIQSIAGNIIITRVLPESPAAAGGLHASDVILAVDGQSVAGKSVPEVVVALRGKAGSAVSLRIMSQEQVYETRIHRATVQVRNVSSAVLHDRGRLWGHLRIDSFISNSTCADTGRELRALVEAGVDGIVLDLRDNMGGLIGQAVCVADLFLEPRQLVIEIRSTRQEGHTERLYTRQTKMTHLPLVSLVNAATGSASEALVGALQDHGRSLVIGERTFGKGTIQNLRPWNESGSVLMFFTTARMYTPAGRTAQLVGIEPDLQVHARPGEFQTPQTILREADLFPTALPRVSAQPERKVFWDLAAANECLAERGLAERRWLLQQPQRGVRDYRLDVGYDLLDCMTDGRVARRQGSHLAGTTAYPQVSN